MKTLSVVATLVTCFLLCAFQGETSPSQQKPASQVAATNKQKADTGKTTHSAAPPTQPATDASDKNASPPAGPRQNDKVDVASLPPEIAVKQVKDSIDRTVMWCTIILTFVGSLGTWAAVKTLRQVKRQADTLEDHKTKFDELAKAANSNAEAAILQVRAMQEQITEMSVQSGILQESVALQEANFQQWIDIDKWTASIDRTDIEVGFNLVNATEWPLKPLRTYLKIGESESLRRHDVVIAPKQTYTIGNFFVAVAPEWRVQYISGNAPTLPVLILITYRNCLTKEVQQEVTGIIHFSPFGSQFQLMDMPNLRVGEWYKNAKEIGQKPN